MWKNLINVLKSDNYQVINEINRASLMDDSLNLARAGYLDYDIALSAVEYLVNETNYLPWKSALTGLAYLNRVFTGRDEIFNIYKVNINYIFNLFF